MASIKSQKKRKKEKTGKDKITRLKRTGKKQYTGNGNSNSRVYSYQKQYKNTDRKGEE